MNKLIGIAAALLCYGGAWAGAQEDNFVNLAKSGADEKVLTAYIGVAGEPFHLTADQIIELTDLGVSSQLIVEALNHGGPAKTATTVAPADRSPSVPVAHETPAAVPNNRSPSVAVAHVTPTIVVSTPAPPVYVYAYPWRWPPSCYGYWPYAYWGVPCYPWWGRGPFYYGRWPGWGRAVAGYRAGFGARGWGRARGGRR